MAAERPGASHGGNEMQTRSRMYSFHFRSRLLPSVSRIFVIGKCQKWRLILINFAIELLIQNEQVRRQRWEMSERRVISNRPAPFHHSLSLRFCYKNNNTVILCQYFHPSLFSNKRVSRYHNRSANGICVSTFYTTFAVIAFFRMQNVKFKYEVI